MQSLINALDIISTVPFLVLLFAGMLVLMMEVFQRPAQSRSYLASVTAVGFLVAGVVAWWMRDLPAALVFQKMNYIDSFSAIGTVLICVAGALSALSAPRYLAEQGADRGEFYALLLLSSAGMIVMISSADFMSFFMGLEIMSIGLYALAAFVRRSKYSSEAGFKYFLLGAFASALMLYGVALIYGATGSTNFAEVGRIISGGAGNSVVDSAALISALAHDGLLATVAGYDPSEGTALLQNYGVMSSKMPLLYFGIVLVLAGALFKVGAAPFHMWLPDVYTGSPTPTTIFMASAVKAAAFAALIRILVLSFFGPEIRAGGYGWVQVMFILAIISIIVGNFTALAQSSVKRMLAYSSIAHSGYMLIAITGMGFAGNIDLARTVVFYLFFYVLATIGAFAVLAYFSTRHQSISSYEDLNGLGIKHPGIGGAMAVFMFASAGLPPTAGFVAKFQVFMAAAEAHRAGSAIGQAGSNMMIILLVVGILLSLTGLYYYIKVLVHMFMKKPVYDIPHAPAGGIAFVIAFCAVATLYFGVLPGKLTEVSGKAIDNMAGRYDGAADDGALPDFDAIRQRWVPEAR